MNRILYRATHWTMRMKLVISFTLIVSLFAAAGWFQMLQQQNIRTQIDLQNLEVSRNLLSMNLKQSTEQLAAIHASVVISKELDEASELYREKKKLFMDYIKQVGETASTGEERKWRAKLATVSEEYTATFAAAEELMNNPIPPAELAKQLEQQFALSQTHKEYLFELVDQFNTTYTKAAEAAVARSQELFHQSELFTYWSMAIAILLAISISIVLIRSYSKPIRSLYRTMSLIAEGDLRHRVASTAQDELGGLSRHFDQMMDKVRNLLVRMNLIGTSLTAQSEVFQLFAGSTATSNHDILRAINEISVGADQQAAQTEKSTQLVLELADEVADIARQTGEMQELSSLAISNTHSGAQAVLHLKTAANRSEELLLQVSETMNNFISDSVKIGHIVRTISEISTETNVLAVNAAIEAARAGQHGRSFSVIAEQIRQLSDQTGQSAKSIAALTSSLQGQIADVREHMDSVIEATSMQDKQLHNTLTSFHSIESSIKRLHEHMDQIHNKVRNAKGRNSEFADSLALVAAISQETAAGVQEVNSTSAQQDAAIQQIASQSVDMYGLAQQLFDEMRQFKFEGENK
ncbi:MAG: methyl-accepting chemotaxis sensory transducer [Paenibacillus sp.]|nr:methyl-accepting chemotaxis sensory transducer [Paenibacillus sp.]